jgi:hypothetical protein
MQTETILLLTTTTIFTLLTATPFTSVGVTNAQMSGNNNNTTDSRAAAATGRIQSDGTSLSNTTTSAGNYTDAFISEHCRSWATTGGNQYWTITPGRVTIFKGIVDGEPQTATITVTDKTQTIGGIGTRIVNDTVTNSVTGELKEIAIDHFAVCKDSNSVFYFGENTTAYEKGKPPDHTGSWEHGVNGAHAGVVMPGINLLGARYYQEVAPPDAVDEGETVEVNVNTTGHTGCIKVKDITPLEPGVEEFKIYCQGVGLVDDNGSLLVK